MTTDRPATAGDATNGTPRPTIDLAIAAGATPETMSSLPRAVALRDVSVYYGSFRAVKDVSFDIPKQRITAFIGPSGCGKSTLLRSINRMNDLIPTARVEGHMLYHDEDLYADYVDPVEVRRRIGMVFQTLMNSTMKSTRSLRRLAYSSASARFGSPVP